MTSASTIPDTTSIPLPSRLRPVEDPHERLRLMPQAPPTGWVDGGWWPRPHDLAAGLPRLLAVRLGRIERVGYHPGERRPARRRISCGGGLVRLEGCRSQPADVDTVLRSRTLAANVLGSADSQWEAALQRWELDGGRMTAAG